jgi:hypothetical protein
MSHRAIVRPGWSDLGAVQDRYSVGSGGYFEKCSHRLASADAPGELAVSHGLLYLWVSDS